MKTNPAIEEKEKKICVIVRNCVEMEAIADDSCVGDIFILQQGDAITADDVCVGDIIILKQGDAIIADDVYVGDIIILKQGDAIIGDIIIL